MVKIYEFHIHCADQRVLNHIVDEGVSKGLFCHLEELWNDSKTLYFEAHSSSKDQAMNLIEEISTGYSDIIIEAEIYSTSLQEFKDGKWIYEN